MKHFSFDFNGATENSIPFLICQQWRQDGTESVEVSGGRGWNVVINSGLSRKLPITRFKSLSPPGCSMME